MVSGHIPSRFVPTLTDVVGEVAPLPQARPSAPSPAVVPAAMPVAAAPPVEPVIEPVPAFTPELEAALAERVHVLLQERLRRALELELLQLRPLVHEAVGQVLAKR